MSTLPSEGYNGYHQYKSSHHQKSPWSRHRRRTLATRILGGAVVVIFCYMLFLRPSVADAALPEVDELLPNQDSKPVPIAKAYPERTVPQSPRAAAAEPAARAAPIVDALLRRPQSPMKDAAAGVAAGAGAAKDAVSAGAGAAKDAVVGAGMGRAGTGRVGGAGVPTSRPSYVAKPEYNFAENTDDEVFEKAIRRMIDLLPSQLHVRRALLAELTETGEELLHELATRVRAFKSLFEAWEAVHLVPSYGSLVQQNVLERLRSLRDTTLNIGDAIKGYDEFRSFMNTFEKRLFSGTLPYHGNHMALHTSFYNGGRGMVFTAGDGQAGFLLASIPLFRKLGFQYPIEIMYMGEEDLSEERREDLEALPGVVTRDLRKMINDEGWKLKGWAAKPFAILMSSFREAIFVDADAIFFVNPAELFEDEGYKDTGALFFKDRKIFPESKRSWIKKVIPGPVSANVKRSRLWTGESGHMQDSGVVVVDKWKHFLPMVLCTRLNGPDRDGNKDKGRRGVYDMVYGDKETFWLSWEMVGDSGYTFHDSVAGVMGAFDSATTLEHATKDKKTEDEKLKLLQGKDDKKKDEKKKDDEKKDEEKKDGEDDKPDGEDKKEDDDNTEEKEESAEDETSVEPADESYDMSPARNHTVCAAQLLHFTLEGKPLWFNGWISESKGLKKEAVDPSAFMVYMEEPRNRKESWKIHGANVCCLTAENVSQFDDGENEVIETIIGLAKEVNWD
ncbi:uncharacterized protein MYCGRDRAFT_111178 [Zymoseptoria tritici IPO323]|uniref:Alpha-1,3-mannosyltransferase n=1 Tax=Zymoseptoria tritici (strain CBS 115943 / IPO323) TaxID=336722 RepID=F9XMK2_ZYMTI|nr:uncharacterized protein MYCGRDRAFT_111178 [Zymoseptoria tritici IPO323]EGP83263.1 hypothetical protein MYCGRDRAFT_111178 [Zymoseptoria tritici IPO323]